MQTSSSLQRTPLKLFFETLLSGEWLEDTHIDGAQALLHVQFPEISGLQSVRYLAPGSGGSVAGTPAQDYIQILNTGGHWVCSSSIGLPRGTVQLYDSLRTRTSKITLIYFGDLN